jgi:hypothetical protein
MKSNTTHCVPLTRTYETHLQAYKKSPGWLLCLYTAVQYCRLHVKTTLASPCETFQGRRSHLRLINFSIMVISLAKDIQCGNFFFTQPVAPAVVLIYFERFLPYLGGMTKSQTSSLLQ